MTNKDWKAIGALATIGGIIVGAHGTSNNRWSRWHTGLALVAVLAAVVPQL